jgi:hypothetical protein
MRTVTCRHCGSKLNTHGRCPGDTPLIWWNGHYYGTAAQTAHALGDDITAALVRRWAYRSRQPGDKLHGMLPAHHLPGRGRGTTWYRHAQAAAVCATTEQTAAQRGGQPRLGRAELTPAA